MYSGQFVPTVINTPQALTSTAFKAMWVLIQAPGVTFGTEVPNTESVRITADNLAPAETAKFTPSTVSSFQGGGVVLIQGGSFLLPPIPGNVYDLSKIFITSQSAGDKVNWFANRL